MKTTLTTRPLDTQGVGCSGSCIISEVSEIGLMDGAAGRSYSAIQLFPLMNWWVFHEPSALEAAGEQM